MERHQKWPWRILSSPSHFLLFGTEKGSSPWNKTVIEPADRKWSIRNMTGTTADGKCPTWLWVTRGKKRPDTQHTVLSQCHVFFRWRRHNPGCHEIFILHCIPCPHFYYPLKACVSRSCALYYGEYICRFLPILRAMLLPPPQNCNYIKTLAAQLRLLVETVENKGNLK